jgi:hypothetical protein
VPWETERSDSMAFVHSLLLPPPPVTGEVQANREAHQKNESEEAQVLFPVPRSFDVKNVFFVFMLDPSEAPIQNGTVLRTSIIKPRKKKTRNGKRF